MEEREGLLLGERHDRPEDEVMVSHVREAGKQVSGHQDQGMEG